MINKKKKQDKNGKIHETTIFSKIDFVLLVCNSRVMDRIIL